MASTHPSSSIVFVTHHPVDVRDLDPAPDGPTAAEGISVVFHLARTL
ncbi:hypothetical protein ACP4OV_018219 [Aristida adscensionis]